MIVEQDLSYLTKTYNFPSSNLLLEDLLSIFDEKHIDCILTLSMIYYYTDIFKQKKYKNAQELFLPATLLFNKNILKESLSSFPEKSPIFKNLTGKLKSLVKEPEALDQLEVSMKNLYQCLFDAGFFDKLCISLFEKDIDQFSVNIDHKRLMRLLLHLSSEVQNRDKILTNFLQLGNIGAHDDLKIFYSLVRNDSTCEKLLHNFFKDIKIPPKLGLNLLRILDTQNINNCFKAAYNLLKSQTTSPEVIAAFLSCFKGDITNIQMLSDQLDLEPKLSSIIFSLALRNSKVDYKLLSKVLKSDRVKLIETISRIACGETDILLKLTDSNNNFDESRYIVNRKTLQLIDAVLSLSKEASNCRRSQSQINLKAILRSSSIISENIMNNLLAYKFKAKEESDRCSQQERSQQEISQKIEDFEEEKRFTPEIESSEQFEGGEHKSNTKIQPNPNSNDNNHPTEENKEDEGLYEDSGVPFQNMDRPESQMCQDPASNPITASDLPKVIERLILFSLGDTFATEEIFNSLKTYYKKQRKYKTDFIYTLEDLKKFPQMMSARKRKKMPKEVWSLDTKKKSKSVRNVLKKKIAFDPEMSFSTLGSTQRINSFVRITNGDRVYQYLRSLWVLDKDGPSQEDLNNPEITMLREKIFEMIRDYELSQVYCSFLSYGNQPKVGPYYECAFDDGENKIDLCLLCAQKCQYGTYMTKSAKDGPHICKCGKNSNVLLKVSTAGISNQDPLQLARSLSKKSLRPCNCNVYVDVLEPDSAVDRGMFIDNYGFSAIQGMQQPHSYKVGDLVGSQVHQDHAKRNVISENERQLDTDSPSVKELKELCIEFESTIRKTNALKFEENKCIMEDDMEDQEDKADASPVNEFGPIQEQSDEEDKANQRHYSSRTVSNKSVREGEGNTKRQTEDQSKDSKMREEFYPAAEELKNEGNSIEEPIVEQDDVSMRQDTQDERSDDPPMGRLSIDEWEGQRIFKDQKGFPDKFIQTHPMFFVKTCFEIGSGKIQEKVSKLLIKKDEEGKLLFFDPNMNNIEELATELLNKDHQTLATIDLKKIYGDASKMIVLDENLGTKTEPIPERFTNDYISQDATFTVTIRSELPSKPLVEETFRLKIIQGAVGEPLFVDDQTGIMNARATKFLLRDHERLSHDLMNQTYGDPNKTIFYTETDETNMQNQQPNHGMNPRNIGLVRSQPVGDPRDRAFGNYNNYQEAQPQSQYAQESPYGPRQADPTVSRAREQVDPYSGDRNVDDGYRRVLDRSQTSGQNFGGYGSPTTAPIYQSQASNERPAGAMTYMPSSFQPQMQQFPMQSYSNSQNKPGTNKLNDILEYSDDSEDEKVKNPEHNEAPSFGNSGIQSNKPKSLHRQQNRSQIDAQNTNSESQWMQYQKQESYDGSNPSLFRTTTIDGKIVELEVDILDKFVKDLIEANHLQGDISTQDLYVYDESQDKITHLFELLCHGEFSPGLLKLLTIEKADDSDLFYCLNSAHETKNAKDYSLILSILSLVVGDYTNFYTHCDTLVKTISPREDKTPNQRKELSTLIMSLVHGNPSEPDLRITMDVEKELQYCFNNLFKTKAEAAIDLHTLLSRNQYELYEFLSDFSNFDSTLEYDQKVVLLRKKMYRMIYFKFNFDQESFEWLKALGCLILGDIERIEFITGKFDLPPASMDVLKAITTLKTEEMEPLFNLIQKRTKNKISVKIQKIYTNILRSDIGAAFMLIFGDNISSSKLFKRLSRYTRIFNMIISPTHCSAEKISEVIGIEKSMKDINDLTFDRKFITNLIQLFKGELPLAKTKDIVIKILNICEKEDLCEFLGKNPKHIELIDTLVGALNGNIFDFGSICDFLFFGDRAWICSFLTSMAANSSVF